MKLILGLGGVSIVVLLVQFGATFLKQKKAADRTEALSNMRAIGYALLEFDAEYGQFPDATTIAEVKSHTGTKLALGSSSSNELFRQLISTGLKSEKPFWAKTSTSARKPNDVLGPDALVKGECAFTYIAGLDSSADPDAPVLMTSVIPGTWKFDPKPFGGKAVILFGDSSARSVPINKSGDIIIRGMNLFDPRQPYWKGKAPDIKWPE